jgi:hypothetical protein
MFPTNFPAKISYALIFSPIVDPIVASHISQY